MLFNEPKLLKFAAKSRKLGIDKVSVLFNEPKLLKFDIEIWQTDAGICFSALQRAEIAEIVFCAEIAQVLHAVSVLFNEPKLLKS